MNAMTRPSAALTMMGETSLYFTCVQINTSLSAANSAAASTVSCGCQGSNPGTMSSGAHTSSSIPIAVHAAFGSAPNDGTSTLTFSNMNTVITPDNTYAQDG